MKKIKDIIDKVLEWSCIILMTVMTILVSYQVIARYFFNRPSAVSEVLSKYLFIWLVFLCAAYVFGLREHMNIPFVKDKLPGRGGMICEIAGELIVGIFAAVIMGVGGCMGAIRQMNQLDSALQIPMSVIYSAIPISGICIVFYAVYNLKNLICREER